MEPCLLLVGAFGPEIDLLRTELHGRSLSSACRRGLYPHLPSVRVEVQEVGVGAIAAALNLQSWLLRSSAKVAEIILVGSAGLYRHSGGNRRWGPGHYGLSCNFSHYDLALLERDASLAEFQEKPIIANPGPLAASLCYRSPYRNQTNQTGAAAGRESKEQRQEEQQQQKKQKKQEREEREEREMAFQEGYLNTTASITRVALEIEKSPFPHLNFENLEGYGLAWVAARFDLPFAALLALTNEVGPTGSENWHKNFRTMSQTLQRWLIAYLA